MQKSTYKHSEETKAKMRKSRSSRQGQAPWNKGLTKEVDPRIANSGSKLSKTLKETKARSGPNNPMFGKPSGMKDKKHTQETRKQMSESQKLRWKHRRSL